MFVLPTFNFGVVASPTVPPETFDTATLTDSSNLASGSNIFTFTVQPSASISAGSSITLSGLTGSATGDGSVSLSGAGAVIFGSAGSWTQSTGTLVLTVDSGQTLPTGSDTVVSFTLTNPASGSGVTSVNLSSTGFTTASISGLFLEAQANQYNIPDSTDQQTEATILALSPTNPAGQATVKFGSDTYDLYVWDGSAWYIYREDSPFSVQLDGSNDLVRVSHDTSLNISGDFTMSAWVYFTGTASGNIMSKRGTTGTPHWQWYIDTGNSNKPTFIGSSTTVATTGISTNTWTHLMVVSGGTSIAHYINGTLSGFSTNTLGTANSNDITIGAVDYPTNGSPVGNFAGYIDEVSLFDTQSTALTTALSTSSPSNLTSLNPLGWWRMGDNDGGSGTTVTDQGNGGNNGTLQNGAAFSPTAPS